ncbi:Solute carrier domain protein (plasmid) [Candidatus Megaera polyxenophila]|nr:Solute carrier domain protein [Candidatus Megaera polyxenophila]
MKFDLDTIVIIGFLIVNLIFGLFSSRGIKNIKEYAIGSRNFSTATIAATIIATWIGGGFFYSAISETYKEGLWHLIARFGDVLTLLIVGYIIAPRIGEFLGKISVAEIMGELYGKKIKFITAIASILLSVGYVAVQIKALIELFYHFFGVSSIYATLLAATVITVYSTMGGIKAITFTDVIQFLTFGVFVPVFAIFVWNLFDNPSGTVIATTKSNPLFSIDTVFNFYDLKFYSFFILFLYYTIPGLDPATVQRILMAKNVIQVRKSFSLAAFFCFIIGGTACLIGITILAHNPNLNPDTLVTYVIDNYSYTGLKGLILIGIMAMIMSSADSYINSAAVIFAHDLIKPSENTLNLSRIFSMFVGISATILALSTSSLYDLLLLAGNFYTPVITMPLLLAIFGFRSTSRVALIAIVAGISSVVIWRVFLQSITGVDSIIPGTIVNLVTMLLTHYLLNEPGGWVKTKSDDDLKEIRSRRKQRIKIIKYFFINLPLKIIKFNLIAYSKLNTPKTDMVYVYAIFSAISATIITLSIDRTIYYQYFHLINILLGTVLFIVTSFICQKLWPSDFKEKYLGVIWLISIFIVSSFISSFLVLISNFTHISLVVLILNLTMIGILLKWQPTLIIITLGLILSFGLYEQYIGNIHLSAELDDLKLKMIYILFMISSILIAFLKPKQQYQELTEDNNLFLSSKVGDLKKELTSLYEIKNELLRNLEHETRTPITGITSLGQVLWANYDKFNEEQRRNATKNIADSSERLTSLVNNLIDLSKLNKLNYQLNKSQVNLTDLVYERLELCKKLYIQEKDDLWFNLQIEDELTALCDQYYISRTIDNIIVNAIQYCKQGTITIELKLEQSNTILFSVKDEGIGIPKDELFEVFDPFTVSSKTKTPAGGRGIGLALSKKVIEAHNGQIWAKPNQDKGVTVAFSLPINS